MSGRISRFFLVIALSVCMLPLFGLATQADQSGPPGPPGPSAPKANPAKDVPEKEEPLQPVLPPEQFFGPAAMGYAAAKGCPHVCHHLFCYCGCDVTDNHKCLLDCFTGTHGADCHICQEEAMLALRMSRNDDPIATIQKTIDEAYSSKYPFKQDSPALQRYKSVRKWQPNSGAHSSSSGPSRNTDDSDTCCGGK